MSESCWCDKCGREFGHEEVDAILFSQGPDSEYNAPDDPFLCLDCVKAFTGPCDHCHEMHVLMPTKSLGRICRDCLWDAMWRKKLAEGREGVEFTAKQVRQQQLDRDIVDNMARGGRLNHQPDESLALAMPDGMAFRKRRPVTARQIAVIRGAGASLTAEQIASMLDQWDEPAAEGPDHE